jgi:quercetin dioxygenase-like cupin family protein
MIRNILTILLLSASLLTGCTNAEKPSEVKITDVTVQPVNAPPPYESFDYAKGVTAISPNLYRKLADTLNIRMVEGVYKPGDSSIMHAHPDFAMYVLEGSMVELTAADGSRQNVEFKTGMAVVMPAATHSAKNIGKQTLKLIAVEVDRPRK